jgi:DNA modification methylase
MKILIENSSQEGELVLDPFIGVGAVGIACKELDRECIGVELDESYCNIAYNRINRDI